MAKKLSFLEVVCVVLLINVIHWHVTSSFTVDPQSSTVAEEATTALAIGPIDCSRYPCPADKYCAVNEATNRSECVCDTFCIYGYIPVCGSDGQTHFNDCFLRVTACQTNKVITVQYKGRCVIPTSTLPPPTSTSEISEPPTTPEPTTPSSIEETTTIGPVDCSGYPCPENKYCVVNETNNRPQCTCINFVPPIYDPVCGSDGQTYASAYDLNVTACQTNTVITVQYKGRCSDPPTTPPPPTSSPETPETPETQETTETTETSETTETPTITGCIGFKCPIDKECVPDANNRPTCKCILVCDTIYRPVCGSDIQTYYNECELRRSACLSETTITVYFTGYCEAVYFGFGYPIDKVCIEFECPVGKVCVRGADNRPTCTCILLCYYLYFPICGSDFHTYDNDCFMRRTACQANTTITIAFNGTCEDNAPTPSTSTPSTPPPVTEPPSTPIPETQETQETPTTTATVTTPSAQSTTKHRRSKCRRRKHGRSYKNKGL